MKSTFACPSFAIIGPDKTNKGRPASPLTVIVTPMSDCDAPKSCRNQKRKDSMYPQAVPKMKNNYNSTEINT